MSSNMKAFIRKILCRLGIHQNVSRQTNPHSMSVWTQRYQDECIHCKKVSEEYPIV